MKDIRICYTERKNIGDAINPYIIKEVFNMNPVCTNMVDCEITGIGSGLRRFFVLPKSAGNIINIIKGHLNPKPVIIWSAGFLNTPTGKEWTTRRQVKLASTRGELSKQYIEKITNKKFDSTTGDAGLLASKLIATPVVKKYSVGIILHDRDRNLEIVQQMNSAIKNSVVIDVTGGVMETLAQIASCETIISSSLHGLILADSFHIPNMHIKLSNRLAGDGFKFDDYYSAYGLRDKVIEVDSDNYMVFNPEMIKREYRLDSRVIEDKKQEIIDAFFRFVKS